MLKQFEVKKQTPKEALTFARELHELCLKHRMLPSPQEDGWIRFAHHAQDGIHYFVADIKFSATTGYDYFNLFTTVREVTEYELHELVTSRENKF